MTLRDAPIIRTLPRRAVVEGGTVMTRHVRPGTLAGTLDGVPDAAPAASPPGAAPDDAALFARIAQGAAARDLERRHPYDVVAWLKEARFGALRLPVEAGGRSLTIRALLATIIALAAADPNVAHILRNHFVLVDRFARRPRTALEARLQRHVAAGAIFGLAAGELGKTVTSANIETRLTPADGGAGYRLDGVKYYSTGSLYADFILVRAKLAAGTDGDALASAIVPADREGVELVDDWDGMGQRLTGTGTTRLVGVPVAADEVVPDVDGEGYRAPHAMVLPQLYLTAILAGILRNVASDAAELVRGRGRSFVHAPAESPADDPLLHGVVGGIAALAFAGEAAVLAAADALEVATEAAERGALDDAVAHEASLAAAKAKIVLDESAARAASLLFDVGGASATKRSRNLDRHWRNARTLASHNPGLYKAQAVGAHAVNGTLLPRTGFF